MWIKNSLDLCNFAWGIMDSFNTPDHVGDTTSEAKTSSAVTGMLDEELNQFGT